MHKYCWKVNFTKKTLVTKQPILFYFFHILFHYGLLQDSEYSSPVLYSRTLSFIHNNISFASANLKLPVSPSLPLLPLANHKSILYVCESRASYSYKVFSFLDHKLKISLNLHFG